MPRICPLCFKGEMASDLSTRIKRLEQLSAKCGGNPENKVVDPLAEVDFTKMSQYEGAQFKLAVHMKEYRESAAELERLGDTGSVSRKAALNNFLRRQKDSMKAELKECQKLASKDANDRKAYARLEEHFRNTEGLHRKRESDTSYGTANTGVKRVDDLDDLSMPDTSGGVSLHDDAEFAQFFATLRENDTQIDQALTRIEQGVTRLKNTALNIKDEMKLQNVLLDHTEQKVDNVHGKLRGLNKKLKETLKKVDRDRMCLYIFCCILLLGLAGGIYYVVSSSSKK